MVPNYEMYDVIADTCGPSFNPAWCLRHWRDQMGIKMEGKTIGSGHVSWME